MEVLKKEKEYDWIGLKKRFVSDFNLPIQVLHEPYFSDRIAQLENTYKSLTKWKDLIFLITYKFESNSNLFLNHYYEVRENIIQYFLSNSNYIEFNTSKDIIQKYEIKNKQYPKKNIYAEDCIGKQYLSIDLKKANFQALRYVNKDIVDNANSYEEFMSKFTNLEYIYKSKYTRQVIFGKLNPSRQITIEKYIMSKIDDIIIKNNILKESKIVCLNSDELIYEINNKSIINIKTIGLIEKLVKEQFDIIVKCEFFNVNTIKFNLPSSATLTIYHKLNLLTNEYKLMCAPMTYMPQILKLLNNEDINISDRTFYYEGCLATFNEQLTLNKELSTFFNNKK